MIESKPKMERIDRIDTDYKLALITFYTNINNNLNHMATTGGDKNTLKNVRTMVDTEMLKITNMMNRCVITFDEDRQGELNEIYKNI